MPLHDESDLERDFDRLCDVLGTADRLNPAQSDPIFYFVYEPRHMLAVKRRLSGWMARLRNRGLEPTRISLADIVRQLIDESGRWDAWLELESLAETDDLNQAIRDVLTQNDALVQRVLAHIGEAPGNAVVLLTDAEILHPYVRTRPIESVLSGKLSHPTVIFYPGRRVGQYGLRFLDLHAEDANYRSTIIGGLP